MTATESQRMPVLALGLLGVVLMLVLLQIGLQVSFALADTGGGTAST